MSSPHISPLHHPNQQAIVQPPQAPLGSNGGQFPLPAAWPADPALSFRPLPPHAGHPPPCSLLEGLGELLSSASTSAQKRLDRGTHLSLRRKRAPRRRGRAHHSTRPVVADARAIHCFSPQPTTCRSTRPRPSRWVLRSALAKKPSSRSGWHPSQFTSVACLFTRLCRDGPTCWADRAACCLSTWMM